VASTLGLWGYFLALAAAISFIGPHLSRNADIVAEKTELSGTWIGVILIATVTSLPELITGASAVVFWNVPNIAVGDALGSCVFNLAILFVLDFLARGEPLYRRSNQGHIISAGFGVLLIAFAGLSILLAQNGMVPAIGHIGLTTPVMIALYAIAMRSVFEYERVNLEHMSEEVTRHYPHVTLRMAVRRYVVAAIGIMVVGIALPYVASELAEAMGWNRTFVGTLLVAGVTSLPELVVTIAAFRFGAVNMAIAGLLGSNLFDILILAIEDILYVPGPLLAAISPTHTITALSATIMTGTAIIGLQYRPKSRLMGTVGWVSLALFTIYLLNTYVLYLHGH
jgi:cation:H+ antiporter